MQHSPHPLGYAPAPQRKRPNLWIVIGFGVLLLLTMGLVMAVSTKVQVAVPVALPSAPVPPTTAQMPLTPSER